MDIDINSLVALGGVPLIAALVQMVKPFIKDGRWYPPISIAFGIVLNLLAVWSLNAVDIRTATIIGAIAGLAASGLYSLTQIGKVDEVKSKAIKPLASHNNLGDDGRE